MKTQDYTATISVEQAPEAAFAAINNVFGWWTEDLVGRTDTLGDEFTVRFGKIYKKMRIVELVPNERVAWLVLDSHLSFVKDEHEWNGTKIVFDIVDAGGKTEIRFTHIGLVPEIECFNACSDGWGFYLQGSLRSFITTGKGHPNQKKSG